jgi:hypothetical protein
MVHGTCTQLAYLFSISFGGFGIPTVGIPRVSLRGFAQPTLFIWIILAILLSFLIHEKPLCEINPTFHIGMSMMCVSPNINDWVIYVII